MTFKQVIILLLLSALEKSNELEDIFNENEEPIVHEDYGLDIYKFLHKYEYPVETHWIQTEDGYILRMHRITKRYGTFTENKNKPAVLLMHGLISSAMDYVNMGPNKALGLVLADAGYDVWLGNNRGNTWSRQHVTLDPDVDAKFWDFSFETCGYYDLPAKIDYIIEKTGQQKIFYVGHSQGTAQFFAMAALKPEYNEKIALMSALAPIAYMSHMSSPIPRIGAKYLDSLKTLAELLGWHELARHSTFVSDLAKIACSDNSKTQLLCGTIIFIFSGFDAPQLNLSFIPVALSNAPAGISLRMLIHFGQEINSGFFRRYDYGTLLNIKYYKSLTPPLFDVSAITAPVALYYSQNDFFAAVEDVEKLADELPNVVKKRLIENKLFNHLDFIFANDVNEIINKDLLAHMQEFIPKSKANRMFVYDFGFITLIFTVTTFIF